MELHGNKKYNILFSSDNDILWWRNDKCNSNVINAISNTILTKVLTCQIIKSYIIYPLRLSYMLIVWKNYMKIILFETYYL